METLTAVSLAGSVVQFLDFGSKLLSKGRKIYNSADGALQENLELEAIALDLKEINQRLKDPVLSSRSSAPSDSFLTKIVGGCDDITTELLEALAGLKVNGAHKRWKSTRQAFKCVLQKGKVEDILRRLDTSRNQISLFLLAISR